MRVEWLGSLERMVLRGGTRCIRQEARRLLGGQRMIPNLQWQTLEISRGFTAPRDGGAAMSFLWFHFPPELRGRNFNSVRLRLHRDSALSTMMEALSGEGKESEEKWGVIKRLEGPPWPDWNKVTYENLPKAQGGAEALKPSEGGSRWVDAGIPGEVTPTQESPNLYLALEPTSMAGSAYWSERSPDPERAPVLVVDFEPPPGEP